VLVNGFVHIDSGIGHALYMPLVYIMQSAVVETKLFKNNRTQAVRLPKAVAFPDSVDKVDIIAIGRSRLISPADACWDEWFEAAPASADFMTDRDQNIEQQRESL